jgi:DinB superfamily
VHPVLIETRDLLAKELAGRTADEVSRHPGGDAKRWNAQQVIGHLGNTWELMSKGMADRLAKGRQLQTRPTLLLRFWQFLICDLGYFPPGREAPSPTLPPAEAAATLDGDAIVAQIHARLEAMDAVLERMEPFAAGQVALTHMVLGPLTVAQWRRFHRTHARHHAKQIRAALNNRGR